VIGDNDPATHNPRFDQYRSLYIEPREKKDFKPEDAFLFLLKKGVFRADLKLACPTCQRGKTPLPRHGGYPWWQKAWN